VPAFSAVIVMNVLCDSSCHLATLDSTNCLFVLYTSVQMYSKLQEKCFTDTSTLIIGIRLDIFHHSKESVIRLDSSKPNPPFTVCDILGEVKDYSMYSQN